MIYKRVDKNIYLTFRYRCVIFIISTLYAYIFSNLISFDSSLAANRNNYIAYVTNSSFIFNDFNSAKQLFFNEPLFLIFNIFLAKFFDPITVVKIIIFFSSFITSYLVLKNYPQYIFILLFFLFFPPLFIKFSSQLRNGFGFVFFLLGWFSILKFWKYFFFILSALIHSSFFFVLIIFFCPKFFNILRLSIGLQIIFTFIIALVINFILPMVINLLEIRQDYYIYKAPSVSGFGFLFWILIFILFVSENSSFIKKYSFEIMTIVFHLSTYFFLPVSGRIFESSVLLVLLAGLNLTLYKKYFFYFSLTCYFLLYFIKEISF
jgi:hypothetical protein